MKDKKALTWFDNKMADLQNEFLGLLKIREKVCPRLEAFKVIIIYILLGGLWILLSDRLLSVLIKEQDIFKQIQLYKGWFYVFITGIIFYLIIKNKMQLFETAIDTIFEGYEELIATNEQLVAMEEELTQQYEKVRKHRDALNISEQRYQLAVEGANDGIWDWNIVTNEYFSSKKWAELFGYREDRKGSNLEVWLQLLHPDDRQEMINKTEAYIASGEGIYENTYRIQGDDGQYRWILSRGKAIWGEDGKAVRIAGSHTDITGQVELQETLHKEKELSENIISDAPTIIFVTDINGNIMRFNPFAEALTGYKQEEVLGCSAIDLLVPKSSGKRIKRLFIKVIKGEQLNNNMVNIVCKNDKQVTILWNSSLIYNQQENVQGVIFTGMDMTERINLEKKLHSLAYYDLLTQLPNRIMFEEKVKALIKELKQEGRKMALIYLDVDNFKYINDTLGHAAGDKFIGHIADSLSDCVRPPNIVARLGGDEFGIILDSIRNEEDLIKEINCILRHVRQPWIMQNHKFFTTVSMGIALYPEHGTSITELMQNADAAMFDVKENGKDGFCIFAPYIKEKTLRHVEMSNQLRAAIDNEEFVLYYQPQIELNTNKIIGVEALIRWMHPERGLVLPMEFIPFAEEIGYIDEIEGWVLKTACRQKKQWTKLGYKNIKMSVNLSGKELTKKSLVKNIQRILGQDNMTCSGVEVEITETAIMTDLDKAIEVLKWLKQLGLTIALDDFGTGYSSLTYLQKLSIDVLKIDREFIKNVINKDEDFYIFKTIVELADNLGLRVVAEGIETKEQLEFLIEHGCDIGQGYYFSKPVPASQIEIFFRGNLRDCLL